MITITCNNSNTKAVEFMRNGGRNDEILVFAVAYDSYSERYEYWFSIGKFYKTLKAAKRAAVRVMAKFGYTFDEKELEALKFND